MHEPAGTQWQGEKTTLSELSWIALRAALPLAEPVTLVNRDAVPHPRNSAVCLLWPDGGALTTGEREAWSGHMIGTGRNGRIISPERAADALHAAAAESDSGEPYRWDCRWTNCGNWWMLRARWQTSAGHPASDESVEAVVALQHEVCNPELRVHASWRNSRTGSEIIAAQFGARIGGRKLQMHRLKGGDCINAMMNALDNSTELLQSWSTEGFDRATLSGWASAIAGPRFGRDMPARLLTEYDNRRRRGKENEATLQCVRDLAWRLAQRTTEENDVERRMRMQLAILGSVSEVPWWNAPNDPDSRPHTGGTDPGSVH